MRAGTTQLRGTNREGHTAEPPARMDWEAEVDDHPAGRRCTARLITTIAVIVALIMADRRTGGGTRILVTNLSATRVSPVVRTLR